MEVYEMPNRIFVPSGETWGSDSLPRESRISGVIFPSETSASGFPMYSGVLESFMSLVIFSVNPLSLSMEARIIISRRIKEPAPAAALCFCFIVVNCMIHILFTV